MKTFIKDWVVPLGLGALMGLFFAWMLYVGVPNHG
jgi:hypothetical protein